MKKAKEMINSNFFEKGDFTPDDLFDGLYYGRLALCDNIPVDHTECPDEIEAYKLMRIALEEKYGKKEAVRIENLISEKHVRTSEFEYRWFFKEGIKVGFAVHEILQESNE